MPALRSLRDKFKPSSIQLGAVVILSIFASHASPGAAWAQAAKNSSNSPINGKPTQAPRQLPPANSTSQSNNTILTAKPNTPDRKPNVESAASISAAAPDIFIDFEKYRLSNGLEVILHRDASLPLVAVSVWYHVGPINEPPKRSGFAHLFEHLMFAGSLHVGSQFDQLFESIGATNVNGTTNWDRTNYFETVPTEFLELALWIESDRMGFLIDGIGQKALDIQRDVVKNERRQSFENAPYGPSSLAMMDTLFPEGHPYHGAVIGSMQDLSAATFDDVKNFYRDYYAPSNATVALAGDFDASQVKALIDRYFGTLRNLPKPNSVPNRPNSPIASTRLVIDEPVQIAKVAFGWVTPPAYQPGAAALEIAAEVLAGGKATRLYRSLVVEQKLAADVDADADDNALGTLFTVDAYAKSGGSTDRLERALSAEILGLAQHPPTAAELHRAKSRILLAVTRDLQSLNGHGGESGRVGQLQRFNQYLGNPGAIRDWYQQIWRVSARDVSEAAAKWLDEVHRVTVVTRPAQKGTRP